VNLDPQDERQVLEGQVIMVESENCRLRNALYDAAASLLIIRQQAERIEDSEDASEICHLASSSHQSALEAIESPREVFAQRIAELERENAALRDALKIGELPHPMWSKDDLCFQYQQALHERDEEVEMRKKLEHENAELRKDKKRLDWLEKRANFIEVGFCDISPTREDIDEVMEAGEGGAS
jgi:hypothetical protein